MIRGNVGGNATNMGNNNSGIIGERVIVDSMNTSKTTNDNVGNTNESHNQGSYNNTKYVNEKKNDFNCHGSISAGDSVYISQT